MPRGGPKKMADLRFNVRMPRIAAQDPLEQEKRRRQSQSRPQLRSRRTSTTEPTAGLLQQLASLGTDAIHPWWSALPEDRRNHRQRWQLLSRRLWAWLKRKPQRIGFTVLTYALLCSVPLLWGLPLISLVALLPLLLVPPVGYLVYWLVWKEFHQ